MFTTKIQFYFVSLLRKNQTIIMEKFKTICKNALETLFDSKREFVREKKGIFIFKNPVTGDEDACYISGNRIIWRIEKSKFVNKGRWRTDSKDEKITFIVNSDSFSISIEEIGKTNIKKFKL